MLTIEIQFVILTIELRENEVWRERNVALFEHNHQYIISLYKVRARVYTTTKSTHQGVAFFQSVVHQAGSKARV